ncbi:MAG: chemotaxis protein CheW [Bacteriovorax sp.]
MNRTKKNSSAEDSRYLIFSLSGEEYAMPLLNVKEVIGFSETTPVPNAPEYFKGVINLRGQIISVMDLRLKLKLPKAEHGAELSIIILDFDSLYLGMIVDSINCVLTFGPDELSDSPPYTNSPNKESYIKNIAKKDKRLILNLDIGAVVNIADRNTGASQISKLAA